MIDSRYVAMVLAIAIACVYANSLHNGFHLDDSYGLIDNPAIRDLSNIPEYFKDPRTLTAVRSNADYRPILQITYALNYAISEYRPWSWHLVNLFLHWIVACALFAFGRVLLGSRRVAPLAWICERDGDLVSAGAALLFAVHPIGSGCANYMWARSTLLVSAFALPATVLHLEAKARGRMSALAGALVLYTLALFTKVEAISLLGVVGVAELVLTEWRRPFRAQCGAAALRLAPYVFISAGYMYLRAKLVPEWVEVQRHEADMTSYPYFLTQLRVWWLYIGRLLAPVDIITDDKSYPVSRSILEPEVLHALWGWLVVGALVLYAVRARPVLAFLALAFFVHLSPHSSVAPLAEMHNEHRPYLATTSLFPLAVAGILVLARTLAPHWRRVPMVVVLGFTVTLGAWTVQRNHVWIDDDTFWGDIVLKAPRSTRAQLNYGILLMAKGRFPEAEERFRESVRLAPGYAVAHINLGIVRDHRGDLKGALAEMDEAVRLGLEESVGYYWRGYTRARNGDHKGALPDLVRAVELDARDHKARAALARTLAALGRMDEAREILRQGFKYDRPKFEALINELAAPAPR